MTTSDDVVEQAEQCFRNIDVALSEAGAAMADVVRVTYILGERDDFEACWPVLRSWLGAVRPAATMFEGRLLNDAIRIEIQVTARRGG